MKVTREGKVFDAVLSEDFPSRERRIFLVISVPIRDGKMRLDNLSPKEIAVQKYTIVEASAEECKQLRTFGYGSLLKKEA